MSAASTASLPVAAPVEHRRVEAIREDLERSGWSLVPAVGGQEAAEAVLGRFGELMPQDGGEYRYDVKATSEAAELSSSKSANPLNPHTEASYFPEPPRYVALWCARAARCGGGHTTLADGRLILDGLDEAERCFAASHPVAFGDASRPVVREATVFSSGPPPVFRFSFNLLRYGCYDPSKSRMSGSAAAASATEAFAERFAALFAENERPIRLPDDGLLIFDNYRMLHSRTGYRDTARHLVRYWLA